MAQQHQLILARLVFTLVNRSPHLRLRSQNREPISRNRGARQPHGRLDPVKLNSLSSFAAISMVRLWSRMIT